MKSASFIVAVLCCVLSCRLNDTERAAEWRPGEPRLSFEAEWPQIVEQRGTPDESCYDPVGTHREAVALLAGRPQCIDQAIEALERFANLDPRAASDAAAAYYVRAKRNDRPSDLFTALRFATQATTADPALATAIANQTLIEEELGLRQKPASPGKNLQKHFEEVLLPGWARGTVTLDQLTVAANALSRQLSGGRFAIDVVQVIARGNDIEATRQGILAFAQALDEQQTYQYENSAALLEKASRLLGDNPLRLAVGLKYSLAVSYIDGNDRAVALLQPLEEEATRRDYRQMRGKIRWMRGYFRGYQSRFIEAIVESTRALEDFTYTGDRESIASIHARRSGQYRFAGHHDLAARDAIRALRDVNLVADTNQRHPLLGEAADLALDLGHPAIALRYQDLILDLYRNKPRDERTQIDFATASVKRAAIELRLGRPERARQDLAEALRLTGSGQRMDAVRGVIMARVQEVEGRLLLAARPAEAVEAFTEAFNHSQPQFRTLRASLLAQRAEARLQAGQSDAAEDDLRLALDELRAEETQALESRAHGEELWPLYFARFEETYRRLIESLVERRQHEAAFKYVEKARAFEPLTLIRQRNALSKELKLAEVQGELEPGTVLLEYYVARDVTYAWLITRDSVAVHVLSVSREDVLRWTRDLQMAAARRRADMAERSLKAAYDALIERPLALMESPPRRFIIIPDPAMGGVPFGALHGPHGYLIETAPIEIAGSTALYFASRELNRRLPGTQSPSILLFGDPLFDDTVEFAEGMPQLPGARLEAEAVAAEYASAEVRVGADATGAEFLKLAPRHDVLHVAAHALVNPRNPSKSLLLLAKSGDDPGALYADELLDLKLSRTRLVVLSACRSAGGNPPAHGGVAPLIRPLIAAGVPAVIGSLWDVEDATAKDLLVSFHRAWLKGSDAAVALRTAQIEMLRSRTAGQRSVLAWGPFQVIGHASSPGGSSH